MGNDEILQGKCRIRPTAKGKSVRRRPHPNTSLSQLTGASRPKPGNGGVLQEKRHTVRPCKKSGPHDPNVTVCQHPGMSVSIPLALTCRQSFLPNLVLSGLMNVPGRSGKRGDFLGRCQLHHIHVIALQLVPRDEAGFASPENVLDDLLCLDLVLHAQEDGNPFGLLIPTVGHHLNGKWQSR